METTIDQIHNLLNQAIKNNLGFAIFRLPATEKITVLAGEITSISLENYHLENSAASFLVAPFVNEGKADAINAETLLTLNGTPEIAHSFNYQKVNKNNISENLPGLNRSVSSSSSLYANTVANAIDQIKQNKFKKVVIARSKFVEATISPLNLFFSLEKEFKSSFVSLIYHPNHGLWIGASPEILVSLSANKIFTTVALAGTQRLKQGQSINNAVWKQKEIEEQALVGRYIINCFKSIRLREYDEEGPRTVQSGNIVHLKSIYSVPINEVNAPYLLSTMLNLLHPTSAVGGMPKAEAIEFINKNEGLDRSLFSGFLGPVNIDESINLFVNIRCARVFPSVVQLFAGAGITEESTPENEFIETELKMDTICNFLK